MMTKEPGHVCAETENIVSSCHVASELDQKMIPRKCSEIIVLSMIEKASESKWT